MINSSWNKKVLNTFNTNTPRFDYRVNKNPGPGAYKDVIKSINIKEKPRNCQVYGTLRSDFTSSSKENPGPGTYDSDYAYGSFNKPTFNILIAQGKLTPVE